MNIPNIRTRMRMAITFRPGWELVAMAAVAVLVVALLSLNVWMGTHTDAPLTRTEISVDEAIQQCHGAPVTRTERQESEGPVQIYLCPDGSEILALQ